jgi:hypothetical protein
MVMATVLKPQETSRTLLSGKRLLLKPQGLLTQEDAWIYALGNS